MIASNTLEARKFEWFQDPDAPQGMALRNADLSAHRLACQHGASGASSKIRIANLRPEELDTL